MTLAEWADAHRVTDAQMAHRLSLALRDAGRAATVSVAAVQKYRTGRSIPGRLRMGAIVAVTAGLVQPNDFYAADG